MLFPLFLGGWPRIALAPLPLSPPFPEPFLTPGLQALSRSALPYQPLTMPDDPLQARDGRSSSLGVPEGVPQQAGLQACAKGSSRVQGGLQE